MATHARWCDAKLMGGRCDCGADPTVPPDNGAAAPRMNSVPREPTEAMLAAGGRMLRLEPNSVDRGIVGEIWRAMFDASPPGAAATVSWRDAEWDAALERAAAVCESVNSGDNAMSPVQCADEIRSLKHAMKGDS